ncbi:uncharacterized protein N7484_012012 [Penicillium longicatenatum]|uniref:uncharacterized protein n=1 Tax=Penicillium longicatenatum TaxID=1561947 RepID=UPI002546BC0D|nr:uncharacterized protein N7484_012012 [Penicillium longicatenatum]KAJ5631912.1 hypothetical protein N7484_012012 [Penicillium longicatenatum]
MPAQPALDIPDEITAGALKSLKEEFRENQSIWRDEMDIYKIRLAAFEKQEKEPKLNRVLDRLDTPYERMRFLANRFSRTNAYGVEVFLRWREDATKGPKKGEDVLKWLDEWESLREEVVSLNYENASFHPLLFMKAVKEVLPSWWENRFQ